MNKDYYVTLTGGKNNAGDFLIKHRAFKLFKKFRQDREIIDFNEWEYIEDDRLKIINNSKALILLGGPGLVKEMYPNGAYKLRENLDDIKVPIIMMGIGWKGFKGDWESTYQYPINKKSMELLDKISNSGYQSSVRDYHTLNVLKIKKLNNFLMTGCPAYYDIDYLDKEYKKDKINRISFSLGVSFVNSKSMEKQMKNIILRLKEKYNHDKFEVVFHHSLSETKLENSYNSSISKHFIKHQEFTEWLNKNKIDYVDISGSAENLINYYSTVDLHIGYRVHAHIFMNSISKLSILISEDGRGKAVKNVINGIVLDGYVNVKMSFIDKLLNRIILDYDRYIANDYLVDELIYNLEYEERIDYIRIKNSRRTIDNNFEIMKIFLQQLP